MTLFLEVFYTVLRRLGSMVFSLAVPEAQEKTTIPNLPVFQNESGFISFIVGQRLENEMPLHDG
jgi:hypothetical protein